jgi:ATPase subunit of ABC transporter with duplicated ATPase domains
MERLRDALAGTDAALLLVTHDPDIARSTASEIRALGR